MSRLTWQGMDDTIAAVATPVGTGGIGIVRLSGPQALTIADRIFHARGGGRPSEYETFSVHYGQILNRPADEASLQSGPSGFPDQAPEPEVMDEVLLTVMRAPRTYTREDVVEISCHGGPVPVRAILERVMDCGARLAQPGEFTKRAFLNGRIDLTQAEAVLDIIRSRTEAFLKVSTHQLKGELASELEGFRERLMRVTARLEAEMNFPEEDIDPQGEEGMAVELKRVCEGITALLDTAREGRLLKEGVRIVICGKPNAGKSSLLNCLLKQPRAIVSAIAGTTRDTIEEAAQINGVPFQLVDTAGILEPRDLIEEEAVRRSHAFIQQADLVLLLLDAQDGIGPDDEKWITSLKDQPVMPVVNKCDLSLKFDLSWLGRYFPGEPVLQVSALTHAGIEDLKEAVCRKVLDGKTVHPQGLHLSSLRHVEALTRARENCSQAAGALRKGIPLEMAAEDIKAAVDDLDRITGRDVNLDLLDQIFGEFCIGK